MNQLLTYRCPGHMKFCRTLDILAYAWHLGHRTYGRLVLLYSGQLGTSGVQILLWMPSSMWSAVLLYVIPLLSEMLLLASGGLACRSQESLPKSVVNDKCWFLLPNLGLICFKLRRSRISHLNFSLLLLFILYCLFFKNNMLICWSYCSIPTSFGFSCRLEIQVCYWLTH